MAQMQQQMLQEAHGDGCEGEGVETPLRWYWQLCCTESRPLQPTKSRKSIRKHDIASVVTPIEMKVCEAFPHT